MSVASAPADRQRRITVPPVPESAKVAREFTAATLRTWHLEALISDAVLIASELVTNAISHGSQDAEDEPGVPAEPGAQVELTWSYQVSRLICVVTDRGVDPPVASPTDASAESGHGLQIVGALAAAWGWTMLGTGEKAVWAALDLPPR
jgi:anti-sigma regulatory factor (Ser/Thr protein kinase)